MKKVMLFFCIFSIVQQPFFGLSDGETKDNKTAFVVTLHGNIPSSFTNFLSRSLPPNVFAMVRITADKNEMPSVAIANLASEAVKLKKTEELGVIAIVFVPGELVFREYIDLSSHVAVLNIAPLAPSDIESKEGKELFKWRVLKQVTRLAALLAGLEQCPFFLCAMFDCHNFEELDNKGRNLCPPCQLKMEKLMAEKRLYLPPPDEIVPDFTGGKK